MNLVESKNFNKSYDYINSIEKPSKSTNQLGKCKKCRNCDFIESEKINKIIQNIQSTNVYKSSKAVADAIQFLLGKIKSLESEKDDLHEIIDEYSSTIDHIKIIYNAEKEESQRNQENFRKNIHELEEKLNIQYEINNSLKQNMNLLQTDISKLQNSSKDLESFIDNLKEEFNNTNSKYERSIFDLKKENERLKNDLQNIQKAFEKEKNERNESNDILNNAQINEKNFRKKMKDLEISLYKLELENKNLRDCIKTFNRINPISKKSNTGDNSNLDDPNLDYSKKGIDEINEEIKSSEMRIQNFSKKLKEYEYSKIEKNESNNDIVLKIMDDLEKELEKLEKLKKILKNNQGK